MRKKTIQDSQGYRYSIYLSMGGRHQVNIPTTHPAYKNALLYAHLRNLSNPLDNDGDIYLNLI
jgi:hypothetical protein